MARILLPLFCFGKDDQSSIGPLLIAFEVTDKEGVSVEPGDQGDITPFAIYDW